MKALIRFFIPVLLILFSISSGTWLCAQSDEESKDEKTIAVLGSSVASGWVTSFESRYDMKNGYAARLGRFLLSRGYEVKNFSVPGDDTGKVLARMEKDLRSAGPGFVIIGLSLGNEGIEGDDPVAACKSYQKGLLDIIARCREKGMIPIVGSCYSCNTYKQVHYDHTRKMNLLISTWKVPAINFLGAVDDGSGHIPEGFSYDHSHPDNRGHEEMFLAIVPGLFDALAQGKAPPGRTARAGFVTTRIGSGNTPMSFIPEDIIHSFSVVFSIRTRGRGTVCSILTRDATVRLDVEKGGRLECFSSDGKKLGPLSRIADGEWHDIALSHRYLSEEILLFVDGEPVGSLRDKLEPVHFILGGCGERQLETADFRDWMVYRSALNGDEIRALHDGQLLQASLEVYAPLDNVSLEKDVLIENLAQSSSRVHACRSSSIDAIKAIREKLRAADETRRNEPVFDEKKPIDLDPAIYDSYAGKYRVAPGVELTICKEKDRLHLIDPAGGKVELFPESEKKFFIKFPLAEMTVTFHGKGKKDATHLVICVDGREDRAERID